MELTRRKFLAGLGGSVAAAQWPGAQADPVSIPGMPGLQSALAAAGYNPSSSNSALMAVIADLHINQNPTHPKYTDRFDDRLVDELNGLSPAITDLAIAGDLIVYLSDSIGANRYPHGYAWALQEFQVAKAQMARFRPNMGIYPVPGNHDTDRFEVDAETWREHLQMPPYQKKVLGGVPVFFMNSGHAGMPDPGQRAWFEEQARLVPPDQEVVVIAHHPSFFYIYEEIGLKRVVAQAFAKHRAPVWLVGGHGHAFGEQLLVSGTARFVQMEVTTGNNKQGSDGRSPGYVLLALQDGRVVHRAFRGVLEPAFQSLGPVSQLTPRPLKWVFDVIEYPAVTLEEGFYDRTGRLVNFVGIDLKSHIILCRSHTVRVDLSNSRGKVVEYLFPAHVWNGYAPPACDFSATSNGPWTSVSFPAQTGQGVYRIPIPIQFRNAPNLYIRTKSQLQGPWDGLSVYGWGLAGEASSLTGYEKWLAANYRTFFQNAQTAPTTIPAGSRMTNIEHYAFNIPLPSGISYGASAIIPPETPAPIRGTPVYSRTFRRITSFQFARRTADSNPLVNYAVEISDDLVRWTPVPENKFAVTRLNSGWEEVRLSLSKADGTSGFYRVGISPKQGDPGGGSYISAGDLDSNGVDDLIQYAFDLQSQTGLALPYDPERTGHVAGLPVQKDHLGLCSTLRYARVRQETNPGVNYRIEETADLKQWNTIPARYVTERIIQTNDDWEEVEAIIMDAIHTNRFYRVCLDLTGPLAS